jgi:serine/threonine protein kinase
VPPSHLSPDLPADVEDVVLRALEKEPANRYQSIDELDSALAGCRPPETWSQQRAGEWWHERERKREQTPAPGDSSRATVLLAQ